VTTISWSPTDSVYQTQLLRAHEELRSGAEPSAESWPVRAPVLASWRRSLATVPAADSAVLKGEALASARRAHPFSSLLPLLRSRLIDPAVEAGLMVALGDAQGRLLWVEGRRQLISRADAMGFAAGADWSEQAMGTSAPGLALTTAAPMQVVGAEHFHEAVHPWSCSAVPVRDPRTRATIGVLDVTGTAEAVSPLVLPLLEATARAVQEELAAQPPLSPAAPADLLLTGRSAPQLRVGSRSLELSGRHAELLTVLHLERDGIRAVELAEELHGTASAEGTVRAEVVRLRKVLEAAGGPGIASRPYRVQGLIDSDLLRTRDALDRGDVDAALRHWAGDLLPESEAPVIRRLRAHLGDHLRELLLERGTSAQLWSFAQRPEAAHDLEILMEILRHAPADAPERTAAATRARHLRGETD